jgi:hypothetical protein
MIKRAFEGLDELLLEVVFIGAAAILGGALWYLALNTTLAGRATTIPLVGPLVAGARQLTNMAERSS